MRSLRDLLAVATPGRWFWRYNVKAKSCYLSAGGKGMGWATVMDFVRLGMNRATPRFCVKGLMYRPHEMPGRANPDHNGDLRVEHPDAALIVAAVNALPTLLDVADAAARTYSAYEREWPQFKHWRDNSPEAQPVRDLAAALARLEATS